jgi:uncharacterized LabA/DUF88 family protein
MLPKTAFLVDADFFLRQHRYHLGRDQFANPGAVADDLRRQCLDHLYWKRKDGQREQIGKLYRIFVYDCPPLLKKAHNPKTGRAIDFSKTPLARFRLQFHDELRKRPNVALRLGYLDEANASWQLADPKTLKSLIEGKLRVEDLREEDLVYYARQKAVDMKLGLDVAALAYKKLAERIVLIAGDSDFVPAAKMARREGIEFVLDPMWKVIRPDLQEHIDVLRSTIRKKTAAAPPPPPPSSSLPPNSGEKDHE